MLRRCYHTNKQVSVRFPPTLIDFQDIAAPTRLLTTGHVTQVKTTGNNTSVCFCFQWCWNGKELVKWVEILNVFVFMCLKKKNKTRKSNKQKKL